MKDALEVIESAETPHEQVQGYLRPVADWFHENEQKMFKREEAVDLIADELEIDKNVARETVRNLVSDIVDPVVQVTTHGTKYVGIAEYDIHDGAYSYLDYDDKRGKRNRVVCAKCVHDATFDTEVTHATSGQGSYLPQATVDELLEGIYIHYEEKHDVIPEEVETGASLLSGTTIGGNTAFHAGNDGAGSGLDADTVDGSQPSALKSQPVGETFQISSAGSGTESTVVSNIDQIIGYHASVSGDNGSSMSIEAEYTDSSTETKSWGENTNVFGGAADWSGQRSGKIIDQVTLTSGSTFSTSDRPLVAVVGRF